MLCDWRFTSLHEEVLQVRLHFAQKRTHIRLTSEYSCSTCHIFIFNTCVAVLRSAHGIRFVNSSWDVTGVSASRFLNTVFLPCSILHVSVPQQSMTWNKNQRGRYVSENWTSKAVGCKTPMSKVFNLPPSNGSAQYRSWQSVPSCAILARERHFDFRPLL